MYLKWYKIVNSHGRRAKTSSGQIIPLQPTEGLAEEIIGDPASGWDYEVVKQKIFN